MRKVRPPPATYTIGGTVSGLAAGTRMVLQDNGGGNLAVTTNGAFTFATALGTGVNYAVTVNTQPTGQTCNVMNFGAGTIGAANVTTVSVTCTTGTPTATETVLHSFGATATDGTLPMADLIIDGSGNFYGTTETGGPNNVGTVFKITPASTETILYSFTGASDGGNPEAGLVMGSNRNLYGTTYQGGASSSGTVFEITP